MQTAGKPGRLFLYRHPREWRTASGWPLRGNDEKSASQRGNHRRDLGFATQHAPIRRSTSTKPSAESARNVACPTLRPARGDLP